MKFAGRMYLCGVRGQLFEVGRDNSLVVDVAYLRRLKKNVL